MLESNNEFIEGPEAAGRRCDEVWEGQGRENPEERLERIGTKHNIFRFGWIQMRGTLDNRYSRDSLGSSNTHLLMLSFFP